MGEEGGVSLASIGSSDLEVQRLAKAGEVRSITLIFRSIHLTCHLPCLAIANFKCPHLVLGNRDRVDMSLVPPSLCIRLPAVAA